MTALLAIALVVCFIALVWYSKQSNTGNVVSGCGCFLIFFFIFVVIIFLFGEKIFAIIGI